MIDKEDGNTLWQDALVKEILPDGSKDPIEHQYMDCYLVYDIKLDGFRRKAWLVAGGHMPEAPAVMMSASLVSRETMHIALNIAAPQ